MLSSYEGMVELAVIEVRQSSENAVEGLKLVKPKNIDNLHKEAKKFCEFAWMDRDNPARRTELLKYIAKMMEIQSVNGSINTVQFLKRRENGHTKSE